MEYEFGATKIESSEGNIEEKIIVVGVESETPLTLIDKASLLGLLCFPSFVSFVPFCGSILF